jgi:hypothetical protein
MVACAAKLMREERIFIPYIGLSLNVLLGHPKGRFVYSGEKKRLGDAMTYAGINRIKPFDKPIEIWFFPLVVPNKSGHIPKAFDCLNFGVSYKILEDWLVKCGILKNDTREFVYAAHNMRSDLAPDGIAGIWMVMREVEGSLSFGLQDDMNFPDPPLF